MSEGLVGGESGTVYTDGFVTEQRAGVSIADCNGDLGGSRRKGNYKRCELYNNGTGIGSGRRISPWGVCSMVVDAGD